MRWVWNATQAATRHRPTWDAVIVGRVRRWRAAGEVSRGGVADEGNESKDECKREDETSEVAAVD